MVQDALAKLMRGRTSNLMVAHRLSTVASLTALWCSMTAVSWRTVRMPSSSRRVGRMRAFGTVRPGPIRIGADAFRSAAPAQEK